MTAILAERVGEIDDARRYALMAALGEAGEEHRTAVDDANLGELVATPLATVRALLEAALPTVERTLRANRRPDGLYHSYNVLRVEGDRAAVDRLGPIGPSLVAAGPRGVIGAGVASSDPDDESVGVWLLR